MFAAQLACNALRKFVSNCAPILLIIFFLTGSVYGAAKIEIENGEQLYVGLKHYTLRLKNPGHLEYSEISEKLRVLLDKYSRPDFFRTHFEQVKNSYEQNKLDPESLHLLPILQDAKLKQELLSKLAARLKAKPLELPGVKEPYKIDTNKTAEELLATPLKDMNNSERTVLFQALLVDAKLLLYSGKMISIFQLLMVAHGLTPDHDFKLGIDVTDADHLMLINAPYEVFRDVLRYLGDVNKTNALGYTATDPDTHRSLVMANQINMTPSMGHYIKVYLHELSHVIKNRIAEDAKVAINDPPFSDFKTVVLTGIANATAYRAMEMMGETFQKMTTSEHQFGYDFLAADAWNFLSQDDRGLLKMRKIGAIFCRAMWENYDPTLGGDQGQVLRSLLKLGQEIITFDDILRAAKVSPQMFEANSEFLRTLEEEQNPVRQLEGWKKDLSKVDSMNLAPLLEEIEQMPLLKKNF